MNIPKYLIVHHTGGTDANPLADTSSHTAAQVDAWHRAKGWDGIGYNWFIEKDGKLVKGRDESKAGAHTIGYNEQSIGICMAGNFDLTLPIEGQKLTLASLLREKMTQYSIPLENIVPHRKFAVKSCYGNRLKEDWARSLLTPTPETTKSIILKRLVELKTLVEQLKD